MRLYSPAVGVMRRCIADTMVDGYRIPAGWTVAVAISGVHRDPDLFPNPDRFDPARFDPNTVVDRQRAAYIPFGAGRRACSGSHFAVLEATVALAVILRRFRLTSDQAALRLTTPLTLNLKPPVGAIAHRI
jgi:cytochrome P450